MVDLMQSLRARSMLHCVCLKPYNSRSMVSCSQCGEWYHTYCVKLHWRPEAYVCSACCPVAESSPKIDLPRFVSLLSKHIATNFLSSPVMYVLRTHSLEASINHHQKPKSSHFSESICFDWCFNRSMEPKTPSLNHRRARRAVATDAAVGDLQWKSRKRIQRVAKRSPQVHILPWFFSQEPK